MDLDIGRRRLLRAELLSIGSELTVGETRDTNSGELARALTALGVEVGRITALPDRLDMVTEAFRAGLDRSDLVVSTGGLGPTPDDLTREAIAAACGESPVVDPALDAWLQDLWARRAMPFPEGNRKQAWLIPSAEALPNPNGTAPGWFIRRPDGRVIVALPGPPREMRPMWADAARPRLELLGLGADVASRTYRLSGIGESQVAELLGEPLLRATNPIVATYARVDAVDVRISAIGTGSDSAEAMVDATAGVVLAALGSHVWATGETSWSSAIGARLSELGWTLSIAEVAMGGQLATLLGDVPWIRSAASFGPGSPMSERTTAGQEKTGGEIEHSEATPSPADDPLLRLAEAARVDGGSQVGLAVRATSRGHDTGVSIAVVTPTATHRERRIVFLDGANGRNRAALAAAAVLLATLSAAKTEPAPPGS